MRKRQAVVVGMLCLAAIGARAEPAADRSAGAAPRVGAAAPPVGAAARPAVRGDLETIMREASGSRAGALWTFLMNDLDSQLRRARAELDAARAASRAGRDRLWKARPASPAADAAYRKLSSAFERMELRRAVFLSRYIEKRDQPQYLWSRDRRLNEYLDALETYDAAVVRAFGDARISADRPRAAALDAIFSLRTSAWRRRDLLRHGRARLASDVLAKTEALLTGS